MAALAWAYVEGSDSETAARAAAAVAAMAVVAEGTDGHIDFKLTVGEDSIEIQELRDGISEFEFNFEETEGHDTVRIKLDRISSYTPYFYELKIK